MLKQYNKTDNMSSPIVDQLQQKQRIGKTADWENNGWGKQRMRE
jgi:hypothetical protein